MVTSLFKRRDPPGELAQELVEQQVFFRLELSERVGWFIGLRWIAIAAALIGVWGGCSLFKLQLPLLPISVIIVAMAGYNILFTLICRYLEHWSPENEGTFTLFTHGQILCDLTALFALIHFTGGFYSPLVFFILIHIVLAGILLDPVYGYLYAVSILTVLGICGFLQLKGAVHAHPLLFSTAMPSEDQIQAKFFIFFIFLIAAVLCTTFLVTTIKHSLRHKGRTLLVFSKELNIANSKLTALYQMVKQMAVCSDFQELMDAATAQTAGIMGVRACSIKLWDEHRKSLRFASTFGLSGDYVRRGDIQVDKSPINQKIIAGDVYSIGKIEEKDYFQYPEDIRKEGITSMICLPLKVEKRMLGVFCVYSGTSFCFSNADVNFFTLISELTALAMQNLRSELNKSWFLQKAAHQLRSPLSAIGSMLTVLRKAYLGPLEPKQIEMLAQCENRLAGMIDLIKDLLKLGIKKDDSMPLALHPVDVKKMIEQTAAIFQTQANEKKVDLTFDLEDGLSLIQAHESLLDDILANLLSNAIKYTPSGKNVTVSLNAETKDRICLKIADSGIGIPQEGLPRLFTEFFRAENAKSHTDQGTGLGLMIVKETMDRLRGTIGVESRLDQGTCVTCRFPAIK